eukprot:m51a1_g6794 hypothetical protein (224) ;mRNA; r:204580-205396
MAKRVDLAFRDLAALPSLPKSAFATTEELDMSHNEVSDVSFLRRFAALRTVVLDGNRITSHTTFPRTETLRTLWLNSNQIANLPLFIDKLAESAPNLTQLSLLRNPACPNYFTGGTARQYADYRAYVVSRLPALVQLDDAPVTSAEREEAERLYTGLAVAAPTAPAVAAKTRWGANSIDQFGAHLTLRLSRNKRRQRKKREEAILKRAAEKEDDWTSDEEALD